MFLSNLVAILTLAFIIFSTISCGGDPVQDPTSSVAAVPTPDRSGLPYDIVEPSEFRADVVTIAAGSESLIVFFRKNGKWRQDTYEGGTLRRSIISSDGIKLVDHVQKIWAPLENETKGDPDPISEFTSLALNRKRYVKFKELSTDGAIKRFRVMPDGESSGPIIVHYDERLKMLVRREYFPATEDGQPSPEPLIAYELRNVELQVLDEVFALPGEFKKVTEAQYHSRR